MNKHLRLEYQYLSSEEKSEINGLLFKCENDPPILRDIWLLLDEVWENLGCDNQKLDFDKISAYYKHPVWLINGMFAEQDEISLYNRRIISDWIISKNEIIKSVLDYGGGFGTLARMIASRDKNLKIDIYEPHPSNIAIFKTKEFLNISFIDSIIKEYDCIVCTDVLEHCYDPLKELSIIVDGLKLNGYLIIANNFTPCIKCHLPSTFHLRYSFNFFAKLMGLKYLGTCHENYAKIYEKKMKDIFNFEKFRKIEKISKIIYPLINMGHLSLRRIRQILR